MELTKTLDRISRAFLAVGTFGELAEAVEKVVDELVDVEYSGFYLYSKRRNRFRLLRARGFTEEERLEAERTALDRHPGWVIRNRRLFHIADTHKDSGEISKTSQRSFEVRSRLFLPAIVGDKAIGAFGLGSSRPNAFTELHIAVLSFVANLAAVVYQNIRLLGTLRRERALLARRVDERTASLQEAYADLELASRHKDEFLANMSHELRTPLAAILGMTEAVQEGVYGSLTAKQTDSLAIVHDSGTHLLSLINDILDLAKIQAGKLDPEFSIVAIERLCKDCIQIVRGQAGKKSQTVSLQIGEDVTGVLADERHLKQALINLLSNASKFTPEEGRLGLTVGRVADNMELSVWDEGIGIEAADLEHLFLPFRQLDSSLTRQHEGTGLGLALVKQLVELNGGEVTATSEPGEGSRFTIRLPARYSPPAHALSDQTPIDSTAPERQLACHILLAEDNEQNIATVSNYLSAYGAEVTVARNGLEALALARSEKPDLILMDIQMPQIDGLEATRQLKDDEELRAIPVIAMTAFAAERDREMCLSVGCDAYLAKPVPMKVLYATVLKYCTNSKR